MFLSVSKKSDDVDEPYAEITLRSEQHDILLEMDKFDNELRTN